MIMTPAIGFFYGGLVRSKNFVSTVVQCITIFAIVSLVWWAWGYSLVFAPSIGGVIGNLSSVFLVNVGLAPNPSYGSTIPELLHFSFQLKFAAITPALIIGAFAERIRFKALIVFIVLWATFIYFPVAHWVWNIDGWLRTLGVLDFAGGLVVHTTAGTSALAAALVIGRRKGINPIDELRPGHLPYVILGAALLWFGWFGFNGGSALAANGTMVIALVNTNMSAAAGAVSWMLTDWYRRGKPSAVGICLGAVSGLVAITPASGYVGVSAAVVIGLVVGVISNLVANWRASRTTLDDSLDVFAVHGVGGAWGSIAVGLFASVTINAAGKNGLLFGNPQQLGIEAFAVIVVGLFAFIGSYLLLKGINYITPIRVSPADEIKGLDKSIFGEEAYG
jgi:Amt family ammonium transporter